MWTAITAGATIAALGILFFLIGLDDADKSASVVGALASVAGLALAIATAVMSRRPTTGTPSGQSAEDVEARSVDLIDGATNVRIGTADTGRTAAPPSNSERPEPGDQRIHGVRARGDIRMIRNVDGNVDLD